MLERGYRIVDGSTGKPQLAIASRPVRSSAGLSWRQAVLEHHRLPPLELHEVVGIDHLITLQLGAPINVAFRHNHQAQSQLLLPGMSCIVPAQLPYSVCWRQPLDLLLLSLEPALIAQVATEFIHSDPLELVFQPGNPDLLIREILLALKRELETDHMAGPLYSESLITTLVIHLLRRYSTLKLSIQEQRIGLPKHKLKLTVDYINEHLDQNLKLSDLAASIGMSQYYFSRQFKQSMGMAPYQYVVQQRIERAKQLLKQQNMTIADVALHCGFANQSHLTKLFRQLTGITPKKYQTG